MLAKATRPRAHIAVISDKPAQCADLADMLREIGSVRVWPPESDPRAVVENALCAVIDVDFESPYPGEGFDIVRSVAGSGSLPLICVLDRSIETEDLRQNLSRIKALGAATISRPFKSSDVLQIVRRSDGLAFERDAIKRGGAIGVGVAAAHSMLSTIFEVVRTGDCFTFDEVAVKDVLIIDALRVAGVKAWLEEVRRHHSPTYRHSLLVTGVAVAFAQALGIRFEDQQRIARAALLHDVGKAFISLSILDKPDVLTDEEMEEAKKHPVLGHELLVRQAGFPDEILDCVLHHHEFLDGSGYPDGLKGHEIADLVRILTIADIFSALSEQRAYKPPLPPERALGIMESMIGKLDGDLLKAFRSVAWDAAN